MLPTDWSRMTLFVLAGEQKSRFDDGDWVEAEFITASGIRLLQTGNIGVGEFVEKEEKKYIDEKAFEQLRCKDVYPGDILICRLADPAGRACIAPQLSDSRMITSVDVTIFRPLPDRADATFLVNVLSTPEWFAEVSERCGGSTRTRISRGQLAQIRVQVPPIKEQRAIATALSDADALIESLDRLIAKKRAIKQAAVQQLLTGETRLPGFEKQWRTYQVRELIERSFCGPSPTCEERNIEGSEEWGVLKTSAITRHSGWEWHKHKVLPAGYWGKHDLQIRSGDVVITKAGPRHRVGVAAYVDYVPDRVIVSGKMIGLRPNSKVSGAILAAALNSSEAQRFLQARTTGMAESQENFENEAALRAPVTIPDVLEQQAISLMVSDMDAEIEAIERRREKTRKIKEGMMQELLTGRTRLVNPEAA